jgi:ABC-2 type transport system ATP-binding protein
MGSARLPPHLMEEAERLCDRVAIIEYGKIIDIGSPVKLVRRHCPTRTVVLATGDALAEERLRAIPQVENAMRQDSQFTLQGRGDDFVTEVIQCLSENRIRVTDFRTVLPNLEGIRKGEAWSAHVGDVAALVVVFAICTALSAKVFRWE